MDMEKVAATEFRRNMTRYARQITRDDILIITSNGHEEMVVLSPERFSRMVLMLDELERSLAERTAKAPF